VTPPADEDERDIERQLFELNTLFYPRSHWSNQGPFASPASTDLLLLLYAAKRRELLKVSEEIIKTHAFTHFPRAKDFASEHDHELWLVAARRRGADDLKDHTWSALQYLRKRFPRGRIDAFSGGLPFCYVMPRRGIVVTAGNISPELMLDFMVQQGTPRLGIVGEQMVPAPHFGEGYFRGTGRTCLKWIECLPRTFAALKERYDERERLIQEGMETLFRSGFPDSLSGSSAQTRRQRDPHDAP
jgi:hypothetical protein